MVISARSKIVVAGAGSIGCFVGGLLSRAGRHVSLLGRPRIVDEIGAHGLRLTDLAGLDARVERGALLVTADPETLRDAAVVLVTVKSGATAEMAEIIRAHAPADAVVLSLQNGVSNADVLRKHLPERSVLAGMVPFNVVQNGLGNFHRGTTGNIVIESGGAGVAALLSVADLHIGEDADMPGILWGKLLLNLNNAFNALSGLPLKEQLESKAWRTLLARQQSEALKVLRAAKLKPRAGPLPAALLPYVLRLPTRLFRMVAARNLAIDPQARSSMWEDLERHRTTEIEELQGRIAALAKTLGMHAPMSERVVALIHEAEAASAGSPRLLPGEVLARIDDRALAR